MKRRKRKIKWWVRFWCVGGNEVSLLPFWLHTGRRMAADLRLAVRYGSHIVAVNAVGGWNISQTEPRRLQVPQVPIGPSTGSTRDPIKRHMPIHPRNACFTHFNAWHVCWAWPFEAFDGHGNAETFESHRFHDLDSTDQVHQRGTQGDIHTWDHLTGPLISAAHTKTLQPQPQPHRTHCTARRKTPETPKCTWKPGNVWWCVVEWKTLIWFILWGSCWRLRLPTLILPCVAVFTLLLLLLLRSHPDSPFSLSNPRKRMTWRILHYLLGHLFSWPFHWLLWHHPGPTHDIPWLQHASLCPQSRHYPVSLEQHES